MSDSHGARSIFSGDGDGTAIYASINVKPEGGGGGTPGICRAFDFSREFLVKIPTVGPRNFGQI